MLEDIEFLDDATRPAPVELEGLTEAQRAPGLHLRMVHDHLRDNMQTLGRLIERAAEGNTTATAVTDEAASLAVVTNYRRFGNLCGQHCQIVNVHHSIEDQAIFPAIAAQGAAFKAIADRLRAEHVVVHELLVRLIDALGDLATKPGPTRIERWSACCSRTSATRKLRSATPWAISISPRTGPAGHRRLPPSSSASRRQLRLPPLPA